MSKIDLLNKIVEQSDGRIIYANGFGGISTVEPLTKTPAWNLDKDRFEISQMDKSFHGWK